jgi:hypothetical protein
VSKGDRIEVTTVVGTTAMTIGLTASKAGRTVRQRQTSTKDGRWIHVEELTRTGNGTGRSMKIRLDTVVSISEERVDDSNGGGARPKPKPKAKAATIPMNLEVPE